MLLPGVNLNEMMTVTQMREELKNKYKFDRAAELSIEEIEEIWEANSLHRAIEELADNVDFPVLPTSALTAGDKWDELCEIDFSFGGSFIANPDVDEKHIPAILELMASFVLFDDKKKKHTTWQKDGSMFAAMPKMFIDFASKCRVDIGYRLLRRCIRHALDSRTISLDNKKAKLILYKGKMGIHLTTPIPASTKKDVYGGSIVLSKDELL